MTWRVSLPCCEVFEDFDREIHCQHVHFFGGATKYNHKKCCDHSACVKMREEERESKHNLVNVESKNGSDSDDHGLDGS